MGKKAGSGGRVGTLVMKMAGFAVGHRRAHVMRWRWDHRGAGIAITLSKPTAHADGVLADPHEVGYAPGDSQSNADENRVRERSSSRPTEEPTPTQEPTATRSATMNPSRSPDPRGDHYDPDSHCSPENVDCHPVGDDQPVATQPIAERKPVAVLVRGERASRNQRSFLDLVGAGGSIACSRDSDAPSRAGTPSTGLEG